MSAQRFVAANATDALRQIKSVLGADAVVLSNREVPEGIEIVAIAAAALGQLTPNGPLSPPAPAPKTASAPPTPSANEVARRLIGAAAPARRQPDAAPTSLAIRAALRDDMREPQRPATDSFVPGRSRYPAAGAQRLEPSVKPAAAAPSAFAPAAAAAYSPAAYTAVPADAGMRDLGSQMAEVKQLLSGHLATNYWATLQKAAPGHAELTRRLLNAGLSSQMVGQMLAELPVQSDFDLLLESAQSWVQSRIKTQDAFSLFDIGGVFAFLGPTGVGKTTTVAKIAARCVLRYGRRNVALLTTDTFRIGAQEQLRVFARILNLPVVSLRDSDDLEARLADLSTRKVVLLDTAGVGQRDSMMMEQLDMISKGCSAVHRILVMSATTSTRTLDDVIESHQNAMGGHDIHAAIVTKIDEGMSLAPTIDCVMRHKLPLLFLSNGQRVPEDLFAADAAYLAHRTVNPRGRNSSDTEAAHIPALIADEMSTWTPNFNTP
jgi:flagellar biosynthesis protein FlhF